MTSVACRTGSWFWTASDAAGTAPAAAPAGARSAARSVRVMAAGLALAVCGAGFAQQYPVKPVRLVMGFAPGGGVDIMARLFSPKFAEALGQQVIIDGRPGAGSNIAMEHVVKSPPDGYTLLINTPNLTVNMSLYRNLSFDSARDFAPISVLAASPNLLTVHPSVPARTVKELIALARAKPGALNFSSGSVGTTQHLSGELFKLRTGTYLVHVPYKGSGPSLAALVGGEVEMTFANVPSLINYIKAERLRPLASTTAERLSMLPDVPTMRESGVDMEVVVWYYLVAPAGTPPAIISRLADIAIKAARSPDIKERLTNLGAYSVGYGPEQTGKLIRSEIALWAEVVKASGAQPN